MKFFAILLLLISTGFSKERPHLEIKIQSSFICENGISLNGPTYEKFCKTRNDIRRILYVNFTPSDDVLYLELMSNKGELGSVFDWCTKEVSDQRTGPSCVLNVSKKNNRSPQNLTVDFPGRKNFLRVNISSLERGSNYNASLLEWGSGSNASSQLFEIKNP